MQTFDVVVIGAGIVGLVQALALKKSGLRVAVIDSQVAPVMPVGPAQLRVSALTLATQNVVQALGAWQKLDQNRIAAYNSMLVWEQDSFAKIEFAATEVKQQQLGYIVENDALVASLWQQAQQADFIELFADSPIKQLVLSPQSNFISLVDERMLTARLVIGADGANSMVRSVANFPLTFWDYDQHAIVATIKIAVPHGNVARQIFTPSGPLAFLPLWDQLQCSIVWSQDEPQASKLMSLSDSEFNKALTVAFDGQLGLCELVSERQSYPLKMRYARQWLNEGVVIVGDAAHTIHPLAGQGANLGILDAAALAEQICTLVAQDKDFSLLRNLRPFERWRKTDTLKMIAAMEGFKRLFAGNESAKKIIRDIGLSTVNQLPIGKNAIIKHAMGLSGELPALAKSL
ncbi:FAD-dependent monooxygenase [Paraglaciecola sp.]|uniref:FAD-dependent monooxygenase n=1 Tax=Paraglaciecola sp. TaxID=1920173 RepID=UPI0030F3BDCF